MINLFCECRINEKAIALIRLMDERGCKPSVDTYSPVIDRLCNDRMVDEAVKLFNHMVFHKRILPNVVTFQSLVISLSIRGRSDDAFKLLNEMEDKRISPDVTIYNIMVDRFCKQGKMDEAIDVLETMIERGKDPNLVTYTSLIDGYCLRRNITKAKEIFYSIRIRGLTPDVATYNSLLNGYCKNLDVDNSIRLFHEITEKGMKPNIITYHTMLHGLFQAKHPRYAYKLFDEMQTIHNLIPNDYTYSILLEGLCDDNQLEKALSIFHLMSDNKIKVGLNIYNILIDGASKCGKPDISKFLFNDLTVKGLHPNSVTYDVMISSFCREGFVTEANELFQKMAEMGFDPSSRTYNVLLEGLLKSKEHDMLEMLLWELDRCGLTPNDSILSMLDDLITSKSLEVDDTLLKLIRKKWMRASSFRSRSRYIKDFAGKEEGRCLEEKC